MRLFFLTLKSKTKDTTNINWYKRVFMKFIDTKLFEIENSTNFSLKVKIIHGKKLGRKLNFPTANFDFKDIVNTPYYGVYAVYVLYDNEKHMGVMNFGTKPSFDDDSVNGEVHIFDFDEDIYEKEIEIFFVEKLRDQQKFNSLDELKAQIEKDKLKALSILKSQD